MKILITGSHGFVGINLAKALAKDNTIYGLGTNNNQQDGVEKNFTWENLRARTLPEVDAIIHLAGKAHDTKNKSKADVYFQVNTELTKKIFDYFLQSEAKTFVFFSSIKAAADHMTEDSPITEDIKCAPFGPYGESKIAAENYIREKFDFTNNCDKRVYIMRPCMIHGPGNKGNLNLLYNVVRHKIPYPLGAFENRRSYLSIDNLIFIIQNALTQDINSGIYNLADDESISTNTLIEVISDTLGIKRRIWNVPKFFIHPIAFLGGFLHLPLNNERLNKLTENYIVSNQKIKQAIGVNKLPINVKDGLSYTIKSFSKK